MEHIGYVTLELPIRKSYGNLHLKMEESAGATTLTNLGRLATATASLSGGKFVTVCVCINLIALRTAKTLYMCMYSNSRNDVPQVAQRYRTIAAHIQRRASVLVKTLAILI